MVKIFVIFFAEFHICKVIFATEMPATANKCIGFGKQPLIIDNAITCVLRLSLSLQHPPFWLVD